MCQIYICAIPFVPENLARDRQHYSLLLLWSVEVFLVPYHEHGSPRFLTSWKSLNFSPAFCGRSKVIYSLSVWFIQTLDPNPWGLHLCSISSQTNTLSVWDYPSEFEYTYWEYLFVDLGGLLFSFSLAMNQNMFGL